MSGWVERDATETHGPCGGKPGERNPRSEIAGADESMRVYGAETGGLRASWEGVYIFCTLRDLQVSLVPKEEWGKNQLTDDLMYVPRS